MALMAFWRYFFGTQWANVQNSAHIGKLMCVVQLNMVAETKYLKIQKSQKSD